MPAVIAETYDPRLCELGEGPLWHPERQQLFWFDIPRRRLLGRHGDAALEWRFEEQVSAAGWIDRDTLLIASETALLRFDIATSDSEILCLLESDNPDTRSNDGRADPQGGFWIGTMGQRMQPSAGAIYRFFRGRLERLFDGITVANSICFAPDGRTAYFADTPTHRVMRQALDAEGWPDGRPEVFLDLSAERLFPDGSVIDATGALWNAQWGAGRVARYLPDGRFDGAVAVGGRLASCPAFGGAALTDLFVTTARQGLRAPDHAQGAVYRAATAHRGLPEPRVIL